MAKGYSRKEVDALLFVVQEFLEGEDDLTIEEVRSLTFKVKRGGYFESQVDAYIERLVEYLQTLKYGEPAPISPVPTYGFGSASPGEPIGPSQSSSPYSEYE
jgi:DivIVA domain-containing protein